MADSQYRVEKPEGSDRERITLPPRTNQLPRLHVPKAPHRPGDEPRFARFSSQPGDLPRLDPLVEYSAMAEHAQGLVRVLDEEGNATGPWDPALKAGVLRRGLEWMMQTRVMDARLLTMQRQGRLSFYLESGGEEAVAIAAGMALEASDLLFPSYRVQGLFLLRGMPLLDIMCQCIGNRRDVSKGRQMPVHYSWRRGNLVSISSPVGTQFPQAVGAAMAAAYRREPQVVATWIGDGTTAQGDFHYALNFASVYMPPVLLNVVNNQWAISTHRSMATGGKTFASRAESYGLPGIRVDGNDFLAVYAVTRWAAERARRGVGPTLIELLTYRRGAHSTSDDPSRYRPSDEARLWPGGDPIQRLAQHLKRVDEWSDDRQERLQEKMEKSVAETFKQAEQCGALADGAQEPPESMFDDVYAHLPEHLERQRQQLQESCDAETEDD